MVLLQGNGSLETLSLNKLGSSCPNGHLECPLPPALLGRAANKLTKLILDNLGWTCSVSGEQMEVFFQGITEDTDLKELVLSSAPYVTGVNPVLLVSALMKLEKITFSLTYITLEQIQALMMAVQGKTILKELSIYLTSDIKYNIIQILDASILAAGINCLEKVQFENVNLDSEQVGMIMSESLKGTKLQELKLDRYDKDRSHLYLPIELLDKIPFTFEFN